MRALAVSRFLVALVGTNVKASWALRGSFWAQVVLMAGNDFIWFAMWTLVFARFPEIGGWHLSDMMVLQGVLAAGFGVSVLLAYGVRDLARSIAEGELDVVLAQPKPALLHAIASRTNVSGLGDLAFGAILLAWSGRVDAAGVPVAALAIACGAVTMTAASVLFHSSAFWLGPVQPLAAQMREFLVLFSGYPDAVFAGGLRGLLFTVIPAGFAAWLPASLVRGFTWEGLGAAVGGSTALALAAGLVFRAGLHRYASGSRFTVRG